MRNEFDANNEMFKGIAAAQRIAPRQIYTPARRQSAGFGLFNLVVLVGFATMLGVVAALALS